MTSEIAGRLAAIVGAAHVRAGGPGDAVDGVAAQLVAAPGSPEEAAQLLRAAGEAGLAAVARGGGTKLGWGNRPQRADLLVDTARLSRVVDHAWGDMTATVQAGCTIGQLQSTLAEHGQRLAADPLWPARATVGGVLATNDCGALRVRYGGLRDQILGATVALADGTLARSGGRVVKNVAGYDLPKLMTGALGTLGLIVEVTLRLYPLPTAVRELRVPAADAADATRMLLAVLDSSLAPAAVQLRAGGDAAPQLDLRFEALPAALDDQERRLAQIVGAAPQPGDAAAWGAREALWAGAEPAIVARLSALPADTAQLCGQIAQVAARLQLGWRMALSGVGAGWLRLEGANDEALLAALAHLQGALRAQGGSLSAMGCPASLKGRADVWGEQGDALPLMRAVKRRFDPAGTLSPGRFVGGI